MTRGPFHTLRIHCKSATTRPTRASNNGNATGAPRMVVHRSHPDIATAHCGAPGHGVERGSFRGASIRLWCRRRCSWKTALGRRRSARRRRSATLTTRGGASQTSEAVDRGRVREIADLTTRSALWYSVDVRRPQTEIGSRGRSVGPTSFHLRTDPCRRAGRPFQTNRGTQRRSRRDDEPRTHNHADQASSRRTHLLRARLL
jgi:hypothetical protein